MNWITIISRKITREEFKNPPKQKEEFDEFEGMDEYEINKVKKQRHGDDLIDEKINSPY